MSITLNTSGYENAKKLIQQGKIDESDSWQQSQPSAQQEDEFLAEHGFEEYSKWYLAIDTSKPEDTKAHYKFPFGNFDKIFRRGIIAAETRSGQYKYNEVRQAATRLLDMVDTQKK